VDADKTSYGAYYDELLPRVRPNGLILFDNVLWGGGVLNDADGSASTGAIRALNDLLACDQRVEGVMLPIADGLTIVRKR
jgi:caffeoyl-CoA O-methyltransferase